MYRRFSFPAILKPALVVVVDGHQLIKHGHCYWSYVQYFLESLKCSLSKEMNYDRLVVLECYSVTSRPRSV